MSKFVNEKEAELIAKKCLEDYMNKCKCQNLEDVKRASEKMCAMANDFMETVHSEDLKTDVVQ